MGIIGYMTRRGARPTGTAGTLMGRGMNLFHRPQWSWALDNVSIGPDDAVLDVGCGGGQTVRLLAGMAPSGKVVGLDCSGEMIQLARRVNRRLIEEGRVEAIRGTVSSLPFDDEVFDLVTAFNTHYFWPDMKGGLQEIRRVLKAGGALLLFDEGYRKDEMGKFEREFERATGVKLLGPGETQDLLTDSGYVNTDIVLRPEKGWLLAKAKRGG